MWIFKLSILQLGSVFAVRISRPATKSRLVQSTVVATPKYSGFTTSSPLAITHDKRNAKTLDQDRKRGIIGKHSSINK
ncbi:hypothetical protein HOY80DRAFT_958188 [Tuber brumale]|nr:hypothetical protein HOY80DRAFT_958188 [Tuber brumale]